MTYDSVRDRLLTDGKVMSMGVAPLLEASRQRLAPQIQARLAQRLREREPLRRRYSKEAPLSFAQQRLWFLDQLEPGEPSYHVHCALRLIGPLHRDHLQAALNETFRRHESLRTVILARGGVPIQCVSDAATVPLPVVECAHGELQGRMQAEAARPFDLARDQMLRVCLFQTAADDHVLQFTLHHIASDAWSLELLLEECLTFYRQSSAGQPPSLPDPLIQYSDFALWQRETLEGPSLKRHLDYWKSKLAGAPDALELPVDSAAPAVPTNCGATRSIVLSKQLFQSLADLAQQENATFFMVLLAAFKVLLHRYSGQEDIIVGSPISRRSERQSERLIGFFLNTLVLRTDLSGDPAFRETLARVRETALEAYAHQAVPFEKLVEELQPERDARRTPFFNVMFSFQETPRPLPVLDGLQIQRVDVDLPVAPFDLTLLARGSHDGLVIELEYKTDLFSEAAVNRLLGHFDTLLQAIARNPDERIGSLPLLTMPEQRQLLDEFNPADTNYPKDRCLHDLFEEQAARTPNAVALQFGAHRMSYRELNERSNQLAHFLRALGVRVETPVGLFTERSFESIIGLLGILKAGGAYVPLEPDEAPERLAFKLRDAGVSFLLTQTVLAGALPKERPRIVWLDADHAGISRYPRINPQAGVRSANLIYIIYTSGSTGVPKGVMVEHRSVVNHSVGFARRFELGPQDRVLQFAPLSFDVSAEEIFPTLLTGGTIVLRPAGIAVSIPDFHPFITHEKLTVLNLPTPYWGQWMAELESRQLELPESVRLVVVGSDSVSAEQFARWKKVAPPRVRWCNAYGTTEATITSTIYEPEPHELPAAVPVGKPMTNTQVYILDGRQHLVPIGVTGEIYIGGEEVARGYLNRPEVEAQRFVADRFSKKPGARLNRTGDLGRWRADGNIEFLGRRDSQVKIRGFRIELGEIESALMQHPLVREAVVIARDDPPEKRLVAYIVAAENESQLVGKLQHALKAKLPAYMIPAAFVTLAELPLLPSGKVDRKALPAPSLTRPELQEDFVPPSDSLEEKLANIWRQVLGVQQIGVNDNFFNLGGHSLLAVRLFAEIEKLTGWNLPLLSLFQSPTVKQLAEVIRRQQSDRRRSSILPVQPNGARPPLFLVHGAGGGMMWGYANLSKHLGADQPVYVFNSRGMDGLEEFPTIEEMAAQYVKELREFQPQGPYSLGGYCFGGEVAYEMAQQLVAQGQSVAMLAMINAMPPNSNFDRIRPTPLWCLRFARNTWYWGRYFCQWTGEQRRGFIARKLRACRKRIARLLARGSGTDASDVEDQIDLSLYPEHQQRLWDIHLRASAQYHPRPYDGHITVLRTRFHPFLCSFDRTFGWGELARLGAATHIVPGAHESILDEPFVRKAADVLGKCLNSISHITPALAASFLWFV